MTHEFNRRLALALANGAIQPGDVVNAAIRHDNWCPCFNGALCACDPEIEIQHPQGRIVIDANGDARLVYAN